MNTNPQKFELFNSRYVGDDGQRLRAKICTYGAAGTESFKVPFGCGTRELLGLDHGAVGQRPGSWLARLPL